MMKEEDRQRLASLLGTHSPSGCETEGAEWFRAYAERYSEKVLKDAMGNSVAVIHPEADYKIMITAHIDEVGLQVTGYTSGGHLYFRTVGGIDVLSLYAQQVVVLTKSGPVEGVVGRNRDVTDRDSEGSVKVKTADLWIDIGAEEEKEAAEKVGIGDWVTFKENCFPLGKNRIASKSIDDKIGIYILTRILADLPDIPSHTGLYLVATAQEELGLRGMAVVAQRIRPQVALTVDVGSATDFPSGDPKRSGELVLGAGVGLVRNADNNALLGNLLREIAATRKIPVQPVFGRSLTGGTDTSRVQIFGGDVATADVSIPCRYMHSHCEVCDLQDVEAAVALLKAAIAELSESCIDLNL